MTNYHFVVQKRGFLPVLGGGEISFSGFYGSQSTWHTPRPAQKAKLKNMLFLSYKFCGKNSSFCGGVRLVPHHFSSKDFEILDLDPPTNPTSHYGACHFGYSLALSLTYFYLYPLNKFSSNFHGSFLILYILHIFDMSVMCVLSVWSWFETTLRLTYFS